MPENGNVSVAKEVDASEAIVNIGSGLGSFVQSLWGSILPALDTLPNCPDRGDFPFKLVAFHPAGTATGKMAAGDKAQRRVFTGVRRIAA